MQFFLILDKLVVFYREIAKFYFQTMSLRKLWPRRALFYTPGSDLRKLSKIEKLVGVSAPDFVAVDIEDGVAMTAKEGVLF